MASIRIIPRYKLLLAYDIRPESLEPYQQYVLSEFIPAMQDMQLYMLGAWHTAYGKYPARQVEFVLEDLETLQQAMADDRWPLLEHTLKSYIYHYHRKLVRFRQGFQFIA